MIGIESEKVSTALKPHTPCLALRCREAAQALGISERLLWEWTNRGSIPHVRLGKAILYPVDALRDWLRQSQSVNVPPNSVKPTESGGHPEERKV